MLSFADQWVARFEPWWTPDLETYLRAIASMFDEVELLAFDTDEADGWTILFDPDRCPYKALPYLAQYVGEILPVGLIEPAAREWIKDAPNQVRGTPQAIIRAAQRKLDGDRTVQLRERADGDPEMLVVITYTSETPDPSGTLNDLLSVVPADVNFTYGIYDGQSWADVHTAYASWALLATDVATWDQLRLPTPGVTTYTRPRPW